MGRLSSGAGGALTGSQIGGSIVPGWGHAIGAGAGFLAGLFTGGGDGDKPKATIRDRNYTPESALERFQNNARTPSENAEYTGMKAIPWNSPGTTANPIGGQGYGLDYNAMRARAIAPTRGLYESAMRRLAQNKAIQGGYSPGYGAQMLALSRGMSNDFSNIAINTEAEINKTKLMEAQMQQDYSLRNRGLDQSERALELQEDNAPSAYDRTLDRINSTLGTAGNVAGTGLNIWDYFSGGRGSSPLSVDYSSFNTPNHSFDLGNNWSFT